MTRYLLSKAAEADIHDILRYTQRHYGKRQKEIYRVIINRALEMISEHPDRPGSWDRSRIAQRIRAFHLDLAAGRLGAASHCVYYQETVFSDGRHGIAILRVLHENMDAKLRIAPQES